MRKVLLCALIVAASSSYAAYRESTPIPSDLEGVHIIPMKEQNIAMAMKREVILNQKEEKLNGYIKTDDNSAGYLLNIKRSSTQQPKALSRVGDVYDTSMKKNFHEIKLLFPYNGV